MSRSTISTFQVFEMFPDEETARAYLEARLWPAGVKCPDCKSGERITTRKGGYYRCNACRLDFTVRTATIFERSHIPLNKWLYAMYLVVTARKGISSMQLAKEIGVTQKSAWFMLCRLREACRAPESRDKLRGIVEIDVAFIGGLEKNKHESKRSTARPVRLLGIAHRAQQERGERASKSGGQTMKASPALDTITDAVLAYKPKPKTKAAKRRIRRKKRQARKLATA